MPLRSVSLDDLTIDDEASFAHVALYAQLKRVLRASAHRFVIPAQGDALSWDRAVFLNLTFWTDAAGTDVLCDDHIAADVVAHVAWHHVVGKELALLAPGAPCSDALLFAESIASAFDLYLVGRLLRNVPDAEFIETQVSIMGEAAEQAGLPEAGFAALLDTVAEDPERAFEDLRVLLFDVARALCGCRDALQAQRVLERFAEHRFASLLHHYQLSNWVLYSRAHAGAAAGALKEVQTLAQQDAVRTLDAALRAAPVSLDWLAGHWLGQ